MKSIPSQDPDLSIQRLECKHCTEWYKSALASRRVSNQIRISEGNQFSRISFLPFSSHFWAGHCGHYRFYPSEDQSWRKRWRKHILLHGCETKLKTTPVMCGFRKSCEISDYLSYVFSTFLQFSFVVGSKAWRSEIWTLFRNCNNCWQSTMAQIVSFYLARA